MQNTHSLISTKGTYKNKGYCYLFTHLLIYSFLLRELIKIRVIVTHLLIYLFTHLLIYLLTENYKYYA